MKEKVLNEITNFCNEECSSKENCPENECVLYRIEKIVEPELKEYEIEIEEILQKVVKVKATSDEEAYNKVYKMYKNQEIILDADNFMCYDIRHFN